MPKPLKSLLIVFSILVLAGALTLAWNQWQRPVDDAVADAASSGSGAVAGKPSQSAQTGPGSATMADAGTAGETPDQRTETAETEALTASSATGDQTAAAATEADTGGAAAMADGDADRSKIAALTQGAGSGSGKSAVSAGEAPVSSAPGSAVQPSFDIIRVEPSGDTVVAGRAAPGATVELLSNGSVIATTTADAAGEFVLVLEKPLAAGGHDLALRTTGDDGVSIYSNNNVAVAVPEDPSGEVLVVMNEPGAASEILAKPVMPASTKAETVIAAAPPVMTPLAETQIAAAPATQDTSGQPTMPAAQPKPAELAEIFEPAATTGEPETPPQMAEAAPAAPVTQSEPQMAESAPAAPVEKPETPPQMAERAPAAPVEKPEPRPQMAETAAVEKPAGESGGEVADSGQSATEPAMEVAAEVAPPAPVPLEVEAVEVEGSKLYAAGSARPGAVIRLYIDGERVGEARVTDKGRWLLETEAQVPAGSVTVRADQLAPGTANVVARVEVPFTRRLDMAVLIPTATGGAPTGVNAAGELPKPNAVIIRRGDNLWTISRRTYGRGIRYTTIYTANREQIRNPHLIYPGQVFVLPVGEKSWTQ